MRCAQAALTGTGLLRVPQSSAATADCPLAAAACRRAYTFVVMWMGVSISGMRLSCTQVTACFCPQRAPLPSPLCPAPPAQAAPPYSPMPSAASALPAVILFNKWLLAYSGFPFPITLTMWHMAFCSTVGFVCIRVLGLVKSHNMSARDYMQRVFPIGALLAWCLDAKLAVAGR